MKNTLSPVDRRHVRSPLIASLVTVLTLSLALLARAGTKPPRAAEAKLAAATAVAAMPEAAPDNTNENIGCGCAEACHSTN
jgi:hypothetical protein